MSAPAIPGPRWVTKRDGRRVPFDRTKIARAVRAAQAALGQEDGSFGDEVADLVELELRRRYAQALEGPAADGGGPSIEEIQDLVEEALIGLGRAALAKAYILYRDRRHRAREALAVELPDDAGARLGHLRVRDALGTAPWSKGRIVAALIDETGLERATAEGVATRVEERVLRSGLRRVSTVLVRELVAAELVGLGLEHALRRHEPLSVPRHDLRRVLAAGGEPDAPVGAPAGVEGALAGTLLERFALEELLDERSAELHLAGDLELVGLRAPQRVLSLAVPADLVARGRPGTRAAFELLEGLSSLTGDVARAVVLEAPGALLQPLVRGVRTDSTSTLSPWLSALGAVGRAAGVEVSLARLGARSAVLLGRLVEELARLEEAGGGHAALPVLQIDEGERATLVGDDALGPALERLLRAGLLRPTFARPESAYVGPGLVRRGGEHGALACGGAVCIDLARVARRAGPWREDLCLERLAELVQAAVEALARLEEFRRGLRPASGERLRPRVGHALVPVGLVEALRVLGDGEVRAPQGARLLGFLAEAAARFAAERGLVVDVDAVFGERAARRMARLDAELARVNQPLLFGGPAPGAPGRDAPYSTALVPHAFADPRAVQEAAGETLAGLPAGHVPREAWSGAASALEALELIEERRLAARRVERDHVLQPRPTGPRRPPAVLFEPQVAPGA